MSKVKRYPEITTVDAVVRFSSSTATEINGYWVTARPMAFPSWTQRWRAAWLVFTGRADALIWPGGQ